MLYPETIEHIRGLGDEELAEYVATGVEMYEPEAVEFARAEFDRRQIDPALLARAQAGVVAIRHAYWAQAERAAVAPLDWADKAIAFVAGFFFLGTFVLIGLKIMRLYERGERRKAAQWPIYAAVGAVAFVVFLLVAALTGLLTTR